MTTCSSVATARVSYWAVAEKIDWLEALEARHGTRFLHDRVGCPRRHPCVPSVCNRVLKDTAHGSRPTDESRITQVTVYDFDPNTAGILHLVLRFTWPGERLLNRTKGRRGMRFSA